MKKHVVKQHDVLNQATNQLKTFISQLGKPWVRWDHSPGHVLANHAIDLGINMQQVNSL